MPPRVRTTSPRPHRIALCVEWLEDRRVPSLLGLLSGAGPLLSAPAVGSLSGPSTGSGVGLNAAVNAAVGGVKLNRSIGASVAGGGGGLSANLAAGVSVSPSSALTASAGAALGATQPTQALAPAPLAVDVVAISTVSPEKVTGAAVTTPQLPGPFLAPTAVASVLSVGGTAPAAGVAPAGIGGPGAPQPVSSPTTPAGLALPGTAVLPLGPAVPAGSAAGPLLAPAGNLIPAVATLVTAVVPLPPRGEGGAGAQATPVAAAPASAAVTALPRATVGPALFESGADEEDEELTPSPDGPGPATDLTPDALSEEAAGAEAVADRVMFEGGDWPDYWRLAPWVAGLAAALAGAELARRRRRAAALPASEALWGLPGLWPGEDG